MYVDQVAQPRNGHSLLIVRSHNSQLTLSSVRDLQWPNNNLHNYKPRATILFFFSLFLKFYRLYLINALALLLFACTC